MDLIERERRRRVEEKEKQEQEERKQREEIDRRNCSLLEQTGAQRELEKINEKYLGGRGEINALTLDDCHPGGYDEADYTERLRVIQLKWKVKEDEEDKIYSIWVEAADGAVVRITKTGIGRFNQKRHITPIDRHWVKKFREELASVFVDIEERGVIPKE